MCIYGQMSTYTQSVTNIKKLPNYETWRSLPLLTTFNDLWCQFHNEPNKLNLALTGHFVADEMMINYPVTIMSLIIMIKQLYMLPFTVIPQYGRATSEGSRVVSAGKLLKVPGA